MKKRKEKLSVASRLSGLIDIPLDMVADVPRMTLSDNRELTIENYKSIESYAPEEICIQSKNYQIRIAGSNLQIVAITDEEILVRGMIHGLGLV